MLFYPSPARGCSAGWLSQLGAHACRGFSMVFIAQAMGCNTAERPPVAGLATHTVDREGNIESEGEHEDEDDPDPPRIDAGTEPISPFAYGPVGIEVGPVVVPLTITWNALIDADVIESDDGAIDATLLNLSATPITAVISVERSSGAERATRDHSTVVIEPGATANISVTLLPNDVYLGSVQSSMNLRLDAAVVQGADVDVRDKIALGHYQSDTLYFHRTTEGNYVAYGEQALQEQFSGGLVNPEALMDGNELSVPEGAALQAVIVGQDD